MFEWLFRRGVKKIEEETKKGFFSVKKEMEVVEKWIKHLDKQDKQLFDIVSSLKRELSTIKEELEGVREGVHLMNEGVQSKQVFKKLPVLGKQTAVEDVQEAVQTAVQTGNIYDILKGLSANERLIVMALMNSEMKLSYEDLALMLGKERATIRGQINAIKQRSEGLIEEIVEKNGKKRLYVPLSIKEKMAKYAKVRVRKGE